jgi:hypothetical protein
MIHGSMILISVEGNSPTCLAECGVQPAELHAAHLRSSLGQAVVAHNCNPSRSRGRDQEDHGLKPAHASSLRELILKIPNTKRAGTVAQVVDCLPSKA